MTDALITKWLKIENKNWIMYKHYTTIEKHEINKDMKWIMTMSSKQASKRASKQASKHISIVL